MRLQIDCQDRLGIAQEVLDILARHEIDLRGIEIQQEGIIYLNFPTLEFEELSYLMPQLRKLPGVTDVKSVPFMPVEREHHQLFTFIHSLPDPVFSIDAKGNLLLVNDAALSVMEMNLNEVVDQQINQWIDGFNFVRWLEDGDVSAVAQKLIFVKQLFIANIFPVYVGDTGDSKVLAGAVVLLHSARRLDQQVNLLQQSQSPTAKFPGLATTSMQTLSEKLQRAAEIKNNVLISGPAGSGKKLLVSHYCQLLTGQADFLTIKSAQSDQQQLQAITKLEGNSQQLVLLDDIARFCNEAQLKLTELINQPERKLCFIAVTQQDLQQQVSKNEFQSKLYYLLSQTECKLTALKQNASEIVPLAEYFIEQVTLGSSRQPTLANSAVTTLERYQWPGNTAQLKSAICQALSNTDANEIRESDFSLPAYDENFGFLVDDFEGTLEQAMKQYEATILRHLYPSYPSSRALAKKLGISHTAVANKLREYGIPKL